MFEGDLDYSDGGELVNFIRFWSAESESRHTQMRVDTRLRQLVSEGKFRGGAIPYGYRVRKGIEGERACLVQSQHEEPAVKLIFDSFLLGQSVERLQIILQERFEQVQTRIASKAAVKTQGTTRKNQFHICCSVCGTELKTKLTRKKIKNRAEKVVEYEKRYYFCSHKFHPKVRKKYFPMEVIDAQLTEELAQIWTKVNSDKMRTIRRLQSVRFSLRANQKALQEEYEKKYAQRCEFITVMVTVPQENHLDDVDALTIEMDGLREKIEELSAISRRSKS